MEIQLKLLDPRLARWGFPHWGSPLAAGLDLHACLEAPLALAAQAPAVLVPAGFALSIGDGGWAALIYPRSGWGHKSGLVLGNAVGVVDADYQGQVYISAWNRNPPKSADITIEPGERIAQMVFTRVTRPNFRLVNDFATASRRGAGGYGSTGTAPRGTASEAEDPAAEIVIAAYRPKPGREAALRDLLRDHVPFLRREGLVTAREPILGRAKDGTYVEVFEWQAGGIARAHEHPGVLALWQRFAEACDHVALMDLAEARDLFAGFEPVES